MSKFSFLEHGGEAAIAWLDDESTPESFDEKCEIIEMQAREEAIGKFLNNFNFLLKIKRGTKRLQGDHCEN